MSLIYTPKGKAREYSPLALNIYSGGCDHECSYCYCNAIMRGAWSNVPSRRNLASLGREASKAERQVLLSFMSDPYCKADVAHKDTRQALHALLAARCSVALLTKGGARCLRDLDLFLQFDAVKVGATLTFLSEAKSLEFEPGAATPRERISAMAELKASGIETWASIEPVIVPSESLAIIKESIDVCDAYSIGMLSGAKTDTDWKRFCIEAATLVRQNGKRLYIKKELQAFAPEGFLANAEKDCETMFLPDRVIQQASLFSL